MIFLPAISHGYEPKTNKKARMDQTAHFQDTRSEKRKTVNQSWNLFKSSLGSFCSMKTTKNSSRVDLSVNKMMKQITQVAIKQVKKEK